MRRLLLGSGIALMCAGCGDAVQPEPPAEQQVQYAIGRRVEVDDSITVVATDPAGLTRMGWVARLADGTVFGGDSSSFKGSADFARRSYALGFEADLASLPMRIEVTAFAENADGERVESQVASAFNASVSSMALLNASSSALLDTVIVVAGVTKPLPDGGSVADAIYSRNLNEVYLTNFALNRVEIFQLVDTSFAPGGVPVGSRPWGIALWPRNTLGDHGDTVVVALSGATDLAVVDMAGRQLRRRHSLPNFLIELVSTEISETGLIQLKIEQFEFSDRPQYVGMTCRTGAAPPACAADSMIALYSTTPTLDQTEFPLQGTMRWENITAGTPESHFFWEHSVAAFNDDVTDTLQVTVDRGPGIAQQIILSAACGVTVDIEQLTFLDTTFVRNSGDFTHGIVGEGGSSHDPTLGFARAIGYDVRDGVQRTACAGIIVGTPFVGPEERDLGISPALRVRDFISNTAIAVQSVAVNFNGLTNLIRADSIYVLDEGLRLKGTIGVIGVNPGMDLKFNHDFDARDGGTPTFGGTGDPNDRILYAASTDPVIQVFDTYYHEEVAVIPIRDPIIGPLRVAEQASGTPILVGVTGAGVVVVELPAITNPFPAPPQ